jgi:hypothetical protein
VKGFAQRLADAVGAARDDHDLAGHLHATSPLVLYRFGLLRFAELAQLNTRSSTAV